MQRIAEEVLLLIMDAEKGDIHSSLGAYSRNIAMAGAVLMDLALENRIDTDLERLVATDVTPLNDELLDPVLSDIVGQADVHDTRFWLERTAEKGDEIRQMAVDRLIGRGILETEPNGLVFLSRLVSRARRYPTVGGTTTDDVQFRIMRTIFSEEIPDPRDVVIISLAAACGVFQCILSREELADVQGRIDQIARLDLVGREVASAIRRIDPPAPAILTVRTFEEIPQVSGLPIVGNALEMSGDLRGFLARQYRKHGPIFRIRAFNRRFIAFAGPEANVFLTKNAGPNLRSFELWRDFNAANGSMHTVLSMDGSEHLRMRKMQATGYSPKVIQGRLGEVVEITRQAIADWPQDRAMDGQRALQGIIVEQLGLLLTGVSARAYTDDLVVFLETQLKVHVMHHWPGLLGYSPRFRRARKQVMALYTEILAAHRPENRRDRSPDYIDELLDLNRTDPQFFPETDYLMAFLGPFIAGLDTSATVCSFMLYTLLRHPELLMRMRAEADALFEHGMPTADGLRKMDVTHRIALETLRMYPIIPGITRTVSNAFEFGGYRVPAGTTVLIGSTVGHHLPEYFPDPERFDIDRYQPDRAEHRQPGAFAPFGIGRHRCLGSGFAEVQIALTLATIFHETDLALDQPDRPLKIKYGLLPHPDASFKIRMTGRRRR